MEMVETSNEIVERRNKKLRRDGILATYKDWIAHSASKIWLHQGKEQIEELYTSCVEAELIPEETVYQSIGKGICHATLHKEIYSDGCSEVDMGAIIKQMLEAI